MFKRLFWIAVGAGLGLWTRRKTVETVEKYVPPAVANHVKKTAKNTKARCLIKLREKVAAARARETHTTR